VPSYSPAGRALVSTSLVHRQGAVPDASDETLLPVLAELHEEETADWERVGEYVVPHALPAMPSPHDLARPVRVGRAYVTGDHRDTSSIQGALVSGRRAAEAVLADRRGYRG
jgi:hypothetical protein